MKKFGLKNWNNSRFRAHYKVSSTLVQTLWYLSSNRGGKESQLPVSSVASKELRSCYFPGWIKIQDPSICCLSETHFRPKNTCRLEVQGWRNVYHTDERQKKAGVAILVSDKRDFKAKTITRDKE